MAIAFRGSASNGAASGADATADLTTISGLAQNDVCVALIGIGDNDGVDFDMATSSSGWNEVADLFFNDSVEGSMGVYYKVMGASPDTSFVGTGQGGTDSSTNVIVMAFSGVDTTTPIDVTTTTATAGDTAKGDPPSINLTTAGAAVIICVTAGHRDAGATHTAPTGYTTNAVAINTDDTNSCASLMGYNLSPSDPEDPGVTTWSGGDSLSWSWCAASVALRPASEGGVEPLPPVIFVVGI